MTYLLGLGTGKDDGQQITYGGISMDDEKFDLEFMKKGSLFRRILTILMVSYIGGSVVIVVSNWGQYDRVDIVIISIPIIFGLALALLFWIGRSFQRLVELTGVFPPPRITPEDELEASRHILIKILGNNVLVVGVAPLLMGVLVDLISRAMNGENSSPYAIFFYFVGLHMALLCAVVYSLSARIYRIKSGVIIWPDRHPLAKTYALFRREAGFRKLTLLVVLLFDTPFRFGMAWIVITGLYLFIVRLFF